MATVNIGRLKFKWQGNYSSGTAYVVDDVVYHGGNSYVCINDSTGNAPTNTSYWQKMAQGSDLGSLSGITQGDVVYYNGTDWTRLAAGTSGQFLKTNGSGGNPVWDDVDTDIDNILPSQTSNSGKYLTTDGTNSSWGDVSTDVVQVASYSTTSTVGSVQLTNCFTSAYNNYRIQFVAKGATSNGPWQVVRLMNGSTELQGSLYTNMSVGANNSGVFQSVNTGTSYAYISNTCRSGHPSIMTMDISHVGGNANRWPIATFTCGGWDGTGQLKNHSGIFYYDGNVGDVDGIMFFNSAGNIEGCEITIHGFK